MNLYRLHTTPKKLDFYTHANEAVPEVIWSKYREDYAALKKRERALAQSAKYSMTYADEILQAPFPLGEPAIATNARLSLNYAKRFKKILGGRFKLGEEAIAKDAQAAYKYAADVLDARFPLGEEAIAKNAQLAAEYAAYFIDGPFPAGEEAISKSPDVIPFYVKYALKRDFYFNGILIAKYSK